MLGIAEKYLLAIPNILGLVQHLHQVPALAVLLPAVHRKQQIG
jgi:hypothetical protein